MSDEKIMREWFSAARGAADAAVKKTGEVCLLNVAQRRKADILFRQFACDMLRRLLGDSEGFDGERAETIRKNVYSELMEDALAGSGFGMDDMALILFLDACSGGVEDEETFQFRLGDATGQDAIVVHKMGKEIRTGIERDLTAFAGQRKQMRLPKPTRYIDGSPEGMDEFEYIDWQITH